MFTYRNSSRKEEWITTITYRGLKKLAFFLLALPSVIFMIGFLKWYIGIPVALLIGAAYFCTLRDDRRAEHEAYEGEKVIVISRRCLIALFAITVAWCYFGGFGNLYYQSDDWFARNAVFRDLISHEWPVIYGTKDVALVYYIGFWLPAAVIGKAVFLLCGNLETAFFIGNMFL